MGRSEPWVVNHTIVIWVLFVAGSVLFFGRNYGYYYCFLEQYMMFQTTPGYLHARWAEPGGMNEYVAEALSLLFTRPYGAAMVIASLLGGISACFYAYLRACRLRATMWLAWVPAYLFWLYPQESIAPLTAILLGLLTALLYTAIRATWVRYAAGFLALTATYFLSAPANLLLAALIAIYEARAGKGKARWAVAALSLAWATLLPLIALRTVYILPTHEAYFSKYMCHPEYPVPPSLWVLGLSFPAIALALACLKERRTPTRKAAWRAIGPYAIVSLAMAYGLLYREDPLAQAYRYDYYARQGQWEAIADHARAHGVRDKDALIYLNLALSRTDRFTDELTRFPQIGEEGFIPHDPRSRLGLIEASEVAWQVGQVNAAQRFAFVGVLSAQRLVQPRLMKRLVETYLVTGEYRAAEKYIKLLESTPRYRAWASAQRPLLDSAVCARTDWVAAKRATLPITDNPFDLTKAFPSALAYLVDDHPDNRPAFEYAMGYLLLRKDLTTFMHYMRQRRDRGEAFPRLYQEAICLFFSSVRPDPEEYRSYKVDKAVHERLLRFLKVARSMPPAVLKEQFGDTYYYYAQFVPGPK